MKPVKLLMILLVSLITSSVSADDLPAPSIPYPYFFELPNPKKPPPLPHCIPQDFAYEKLSGGDFSLIFSGIVDSDSRLEVFTSEKGGWLYNLIKDGYSCYLGKGYGHWVPKLNELILPQLNK